MCASKTLHFQTQNTAHARRQCSPAWSHTWLEKKHFLALGAVAKAAIQKHLGHGRCTGHHTARGARARRWRRALERHGLPHERRDVSLGKQQAGVVTSHEHSTKENVRNRLISIQFSVQSARCNSNERKNKQREHTTRNRDVQHTIDQERCVQSCR